MSSGTLGERLGRSPFETPDLPLGTALSMMALRRLDQHSNSARFVVRCDSTEPWQKCPVSMSLAAFRSMGLIGAMSSCDNPN
jgi:hypothetical protein